MIDSHCHLTDPRLGDQIEAVLHRAAQAGVTDMVTIGTTPDDADAARELAARYPTVRYAAGIHPNNSGPFTPSDTAALRRFAADPRCVALGEMGLDYHWKDVPAPHQKAMFRAQLELAAELAMPVVIHCREAVADTLDIMAAFPTVRAVFHCFTGSPQEAQAITSRGYSLGFTGPITFKKNDALRDIVRACPIGHLLIETDAPYMTPEPHRSVKTNEPMYVRHVLETVARVKGITLAEADATTTHNTRQLYRWAE